MTRKMISTMMIFASCACFGFADEGEIKIPENQYSTIVEGDETPQLPPILEKCKKKKH